jgi:hypothetical protein
MPLRGMTAIRGSTLGPKSGPGAGAETGRRCGVPEGALAAEKLSGARYEVF